MITGYKMNEFYCTSCRLHRPIELLGRTVKTNGRLRYKNCKACMIKANERINK